MRLAILYWFSLAISHAEPPPHGELIFPLESWHNHGSCLVETPNGDLIACWFHGSGERRSDDVVIMGARRDKTSSFWSKPFLMADTPEFPDTNCCMIIDREQRLWLFWPTIQANTWESALMKYKTSTDYQRGGEPPAWSEERVLHVKTSEEFPAIVRRKMAEYLSQQTLSPKSLEWAVDCFHKADDKLTRRIGWFTRAHPLILPSGRMILGLYSDGFSFSLTGYSDDLGKSWKFSEPMVGGGNIQPSYAQKRDGTLVAYMRDNGPPPHRVMVSESKDEGGTWSKVTDHPQLKNPGSGLELMRLQDGRFLFLGNDTEDGRHQLLVAISDDEGQTYRWSRHLEKSEPGEGSFHYPSIIQAKDGTLHATYSIFVKDPATGKEGKSIKYASFTTDWVTQ